MTSTETTLMLESLQGWVTEQEQVDGKKEDPDLVRVTGEVTT